MRLLFANNAAATLAGGINNTAVTVLVASGTGVLFPVPVPGVSYFKMTLVDAATSQQREIVHVTAKSGDLLTIVRAQEGTSARSWLAGDLALNLVTAGSLEAMMQVPDIFFYRALFSASTPGSYTFTVPADVYTLTGYCTAGGGGGACLHTSAGYSGGGGGAGGTAWGPFAVTPGLVIPITVGAGGLGGVAGGDGGVGGVSSVGIYMSATGGAGGSSQTAPVGPGGGLPGEGLGPLNVFGGAGTDGNALATTGFAGNGGASYWGGGVKGSFSFMTGAFQCAWGAGGGGTYGSTQTVDAYPGSPGIVLLYG